VKKSKKSFVKRLVKMQKKQKKNSTSASGYIGHNVEPRKSL